ncbi:MAG: Periplasmic beta-glucosidase precursor [Chloroflexi bacterium ADurb.Bin360]|nr:MAG: Periplasmic beta-glucosidase precursor [Chloroflexi bacterium ADurb.Bin360]
MTKLPSDAPILTQDGLTFRDLNKNGRLDVYEDPRRPIEERVEDLLQQMTLEEKVGLMFHNVIPVGMDGELFHGMHWMWEYSTTHNVLDLKMSHYNVHALPEPRLAVAWYNKLQKLAERTRLGIPVTLSSDPRHGYNQMAGASEVTDAFSRWPEPIGLGATDDPELVQEFGDIARQEYRAVGISVALHPMADLATEPRWARIEGTFGEDAELSSRMVGAYIRGFQGAEIGPSSVICMTKHFPGGGPQKDGHDPHFSYGKEQVYPGANFDYHLIPFEAAFRAGTGQIMPYYGQPIGVPGIDEVGFSYNKPVITGLLRGKYGFDGVVCTDWSLITARVHGDKVFMEARAWGVEHLSNLERAKRLLDAGVDQFGGEECPGLLIELVQTGQVSETRIDTSVRRLLRDKFRLGLFDHPYLDPEVSAEIVGNPAFREAGARAQRKSLVLLKREALPLAGRPKVYIEGYQPESLAPYADVVASPEVADFALLRLVAPYQTIGEGFSAIFHYDDLDFKSPEKERLLHLMVQVPTIVSIHLDRPAVIPEIAEACKGLIGSFGAEDAAVLDVIFGRWNPTGKLPFELPCSMEAVKNQKSDVPYDSGAPLFPFGFGLSY